MPGFHNLSRRVTRFHTSGLACSIRRRSSATLGGQVVQHTAKQCYTRPSEAVLHDGTPPSCGTRGQAVLHAADAKFTVHTRPSCATCGQGVLHAADAKFTVHTRPSSATRCKAMQHATDLKFTVHMQPFSVYTRPKCATRGQVVLQTADAKFPVHTWPSSATRCKAARHVANANATQSLEQSFGVCHGQIEFHCAPPQGGVL
jgi:hypothetical protein